MISIIIPLYNKEKYIANAIRSILVQNYIDYEIIIIDDGSKDGSIDIVNSFSDNRISLYTKENGGVSSARNYGIKVAKGTWIMFLDADDTLLPYALQKFNEGILHHKDIQVFVSNFIIVEINGKRHAYSRWGKEKIIFNPIKYMWFRYLYSRPGNTIFHRRVLELQGNYDEDLSYNEDYEFGLRILSYRKCCFLPFFAMEYYKLENTASMISHPLGRDFISKVDTLALDSLYKKLMIYNLVIFSKCRKNVDVAYINRIIRKNFSKYFLYIYILNLIYRRLRILLRW